MRAAVLIGDGAMLLPRTLFSPPGNLLRSLYRQTRRLSTPFWCDAELLAILSGNETACSHEKPRLLPERIAMVPRPVWTKQFRRMDMAFWNASRHGRRVSLDDMARSTDRALNWGRGKRCWRP